MNNHDILSMILPIFVENTSLKSAPEKRTDLKIYIDHAYKQRFITFAEKEYIERVMKKEAT